MKTWNHLTKDNFLFYMKHLIILQYKWYLAGNGMERAFENQNCIEVSLVRAYDSLVLKTEEKSQKLPHF